MLATSLFWLPVGAGLHLISYPDVLSSEKASGEIGHILQSDWSMKMTQGKFPHHVCAKGQTFALHACRHCRHKLYRKRIMILLPFYESGPLLWIEFNMSLNYE